MTTPTRISIAVLASPLLIVACLFTWIVVVSNNIQPKNYNI